MIFVDRSTITPEVRRAYAMMQIRDLFKISIFYNKTCLVDCFFFIALKIWYVTKHLFTEPSGTA